MKTLVIGLFALCLFGLAGCSGSPLNSAEGGSGENTLSSFAKCLTDKGAVFYGTTRCSHCNNQKAMFGDAMKDIKFIDCDKEKQLCTAAKIEMYPTWIFKNGSKKTGAHQLETLARETGCTYQASGAQL